ncbi:MAG TPA: hypothetical protein VFE63_15845 [Roseiarcus sp.]|nr:hypothetical protein [Roseiarcus sp.]
MVEVVVDTRLPWAVLSEVKLVVTPPPGAALETESTTASKFVSRSLYPVVLAFATFGEMDESQLESPSIPETLVFRMLMAAPLQAGAFEAKGLARN